MTIGFDIGATNTRVASVSTQGLGRVAKKPTPKDPLEALALLSTLCIETASGDHIERVIGGIPGIPGKDGEVLNAPNLPKWKGFPLGADLSELLGVPVRVFHDTDLGALGEAHYGAGKGAEVLAYVAVGTGVGVSRIIRGKIDIAAFALEAGHQILDVQRRRALEEMISGLAISERFGMHPKDVPRSAYDELTPTLAVGLYNMILHWSPHVLVLGGSMMNEKNGFRVGDVVKALHTLPKFFPEFPEVRAGVLGDSAGLHGARAVLFSSALD